MSAWKILVISILLMLFGAVARYWMPHIFGPGSRLVSWAVEAGLVVLILYLVLPPSPGVGRIATLILDENKNPEVSRLLTLLFFVMIMSAYLTCALWNVSLWNPPSMFQDLPALPAGDSDAGEWKLPLGIEIPPQIWLLAGIVVGPAIGAAIITSAKLQTGELSTVSTGELSTVSEVPLLSRMFLYEGKAPKRQVDFAPAYEFLTKMVVFVAYLVALGRLMYMTGADAYILRFPSVPDGLLVIVAVVSGVYIVSRAIHRRD
ncbi:MAG TPA: hypothetical protein VMU06_22375 [Stellaceae bacterium]|nr:hypothetical protein [Stellaceae bacterium]